MNKKRRVSFRIDDLSNNVLGILKENTGNCTSTIIRNMMAREIRSITFVGGSAPHTISVRMESDLYEHVVKLCRKYNTDLSNLVRSLLFDESKLLLPSLLHPVEHISDIEEACEVFRRIDILRRSAKTCRREEKLQQAFIYENNADQWFHELGRFLVRGGSKTS
jgi:hypothetical protein